MHVYAEASRVTKAQEMPSELVPFTSGSPQVPAAFSRDVTFPLGPSNIKGGSFSPDHKGLAERTAEDCRPTVAAAMEPRWGHSVLESAAFQGAQYRHPDKWCLGLGAPTREGGSDTTLPEGGGLWGLINQNESLSA